jgi:sortase A
MPSHSRPWAGAALAVWLIAFLLASALIYQRFQQEGVHSLATVTSLPSTSLLATASNSRAASGQSPDPVARAGVTGGSGPRIASLSIPRIGINNAGIFERGVDGRGQMLIAPGYAVTHYSFSAPFGRGNAVLYGHDDIQGDIFGQLYDLEPGDTIQVTVGKTVQRYRVVGHIVVEPTAVSVLSATSDARLTLITCWPFGVDTKRWVVTAVKV